MAPDNVDENSDGEDIFMSSGGGWGQDNENSKLKIENELQKALKEVEF